LGKALKSHTCQQKKGENKEFEFHGITLPELGKQRL
jgi:hypothetical protein